MDIIVSLRSGSYTLDIASPYDISIPLTFNASNPVCWGAPMAHAKTYCSDGFVGDTRQGGSCNVAEYHIIPHCQGTHTECVGHITNQPITIHHLRDVLIPATLITVFPRVLDEVSDRYLPDCYGSDFVITRGALEGQLQKRESDFLQGLIIRTFPNDASKRTRNYLNQMPPFLSLDAIEYIVQLGVQHLLVDVPSVDRIMDGGHLHVHRQFWGVAPGSHDVDPETASQKTITEMVFVPDHIRDGNYLMNLQFPSFVADVAPCRPLLYRVLD